MEDILGWKSFEKLPGLHISRCGGFPPLTSDISVALPLDGSTFRGSEEMGGDWSRSGDELEGLNGNAAADAKSPQSCPTLCNPIDGSLPGSSIPGILQARNLE